MRTMFDIIQEEIPASIFSKLETHEIKCIKDAMQAYACEALREVPSKATIELVNKKSTFAAGYEKFFSVSQHSIENIIKEMK